MMKPVAPKARGRSAIVAPKPEAKVTPEQLAKAFDASVILKADPSPEETTSYAGS